MTRRLALPCAVLAFAAVPAIAVAGSSGPKATGGGKVVNPGNGAEGTIGLNAQPSKSGAKGIVNVRVVNAAGTFIQHFVGDVDCYRQLSDTDAVISGQVKRLTLGAGMNTGEFFIMRVHDGGEPENDAAGWHRTANPDDANCEEDNGPAFDMRGGNIQVHPAA